MAIFNSYVSLPEGIFRTPIPPIPETMKIMILGFTTLLLQAYKYRVLKFTWIPLKNGTANHPITQIPIPAFGTESSSSWPPLVKTLDAK